MSVHRQLYLDLFEIFNRRIWFSWNRKEFFGYYKIEE